MEGNGDPRKWTYSTKMRGLNTEAHCEQMQQHQPEIPAAQEGVKQENLELKAVPSVTERLLASSQTNQRHKNVKGTEKLGPHQDGVANFLHHLQ